MHRCVKATGIHHMTQVWQKIIIIIIFHSIWYMRKYINWSSSQQQKGAEVGECEEGKFGRAGHTAANHALKPPVLLSIPSNPHILLDTKWSTSNRRIKPLSVSCNPTKRLMTRGRVTAIYSSDSYFDHQVRILLLHFQKIDVAEWENSWQMDNTTTASFAILTLSRFKRGKKVAGRRINPLFTVFPRTHSHTIGL